jgi:hypothetical protein
MVSAFGRIVVLRMWKEVWFIGVGEEVMWE